MPGAPDSLRLMTTNTSVLIRCLALLILLPIPSRAAEPPVLAVPVGKAPLPDGRVTVGEWDDAASLALPEGVTLRVKQTNGYFFVCVQPAHPIVLGMDLYLADEAGRLTDLHASAQLGERIARDKQWPEWAWWNHTDWMANASPFALKDRRPEFMPDEAKEYQISRTRFAGKRQRLRLECHLTRGRTPPLIFPADTAEFDPAGWLVLDFAPSGR